MAGVLSRTLTRISSSSSSPSPSIIRIFSHRYRSNQSGKGQLYEVDLESDGDVDVMSVRRLEDVIHGMIVRRSAPDWLPFIPGSSYWVPPRKRSSSGGGGGFVDMLDKFARPVKVEENLSSGNYSRGWPSSSYFLDGTASMHQLPVNMHQLPGEMHVEVEDNSDDDASQSDKQDG